jgi:lysophospholipase
VISPAPLFDDLADGPPAGRALWLQTADGVKIRVALWGTGQKGTVLLFPGRTDLLTTDAEMFAWMKSHVIERPELALGGPTLHWLHEALLECRRLRAAPSPDTPALTFLGERERIVAVEAIEQRMARWPNGTLDRVRHAEHEVLMETPAIRTRAFDQITALFDQHR